MDPTAVEDQLMNIPTTKYEKPKGVQEQFSEILEAHGFTKEQSITESTKLSPDQIQKLFANKERLERYIAQISK